VRDTRRSRMLLAIALVAALALIAIDYQDSSSSLISSLRIIAGSVFGGAERAASVVTRPVGQFFGAGGSGAGADQGAMQREMIRLRAELSAARLDRAQYRRLGRLLQLSGKGGYRILAASVIGFGQGYQQTITLDAGRADGVRPQQTVLDGHGLVGQVVQVSARTSTVMLATDASSVVGVRLAPGGQIGWVTGEGQRARGGTALLKLQVLDSSVLKIGRQLVTSASVKDRPFVPGVPVGTIVSVDNKAGALTGQALVRPFTQFTGLDVVGIVVSPPRHDPRYSVLPPPPPKPATPARTSSGAGKTRNSRSGSGSRHSSGPAQPGQAGQTAAGPPRTGRRQGGR
jgi:rod shape-determining protein MreC